jgi:hypothetical protein
MSPRRSSEDLQKAVARMDRPSLTRNADDPPAYFRLTKAERWGQALRDLKTLYESGPPDIWHAAVFTLWVHAWATRETHEQGRS